MSNTLNKTKYLSAPERDHLHTLLRRLIKTEACQRDCLLILLALHTGARASELLAIDIADIDSASETVFIRGLKGSKDREIPLAPWLFAELKAYLPKVAKTRLFEVSYRRLNQIWQSYKPTNKKFHSLRHTFAIDLYKRTLDIRLVQAALGHSSLETTMIYANYIYTIEQMRKLIIVENNA